VLRISSDRERLVVTYFSEPMLALAAREMLLSHPLAILQQLRDGFARSDLGARGEIVSLLCCLLVLRAPIVRSITGGGGAVDRPAALHPEMELYDFLQRLMHGSAVPEAAVPRRNLPRPSSGVQKRIFASPIRTRMRRRPAVSSSSACELEETMSNVRLADDGAFRSLPPSQPLSESAAGACSSASASASASTSVSSSSSSSSTAASASSVTVLSLEAVASALKCRRATVNLSHFLRLGSPPSISQLRLFFERSAGMLMPRNFGAVDWVLPLRLESGSGAITYSFIAAQVKNLAGGISDSRAALLHSQIRWQSIFSDAAGGVLPPFVSLVVSMRDTALSKVVLSSAAAPLPRNQGPASAFSSIACTLRGAPKSLASDVAAMLIAMVDDTEPLIASLRGSESNDRDWASDMFAGQGWDFYRE
jgi:hypothetical protein